MGSGVFIGHLHRLLYEFITKDIAQPLLPCSFKCIAYTCTPLLKQLAIVPNRKAHVVPNQSMPAHSFNAMCQFGCVCL